MKMPRSSSDFFDLLIFGSGSAAFAAAIKASELGAKVALTESGMIGGTCVNVGCIPSKTLIRAAEIFHAPRAGRFDGISYKDGKADLGTLIRQKERLVAALRKRKYVDIAANDPNLTILRGKAQLLSETKAQVGDRIVESQKFLIATGSRPCIPAFPGLERVRYLTSTEALALPRLPRSMAIIGGGYIALELGQMFHRFGTEVTLLERGPRILSGFDLEISETISEILRNEGLRIETKAGILEVSPDRGGVALRARIGQREKKIGVEQLLIACGRVPNSDGLGLKLAGVRLDQRGFAVVDEEMRTTAENVWAAGDVTGPPFATPIGAREGVVAAENMFKDAHLKMDYSVIPRAVFTDPEVAAVGLSADEARGRGMRVKADCLDLSHVPKAAATYETRGLVKMVVKEGSEKILGVQMVAPRAADLIHEATLAVRFGLTTRDLIKTIHVYPTMSEAIRMAAQMFTKDVARLSCCAE